MSVIVGLLMAVGITFHAFPEAYDTTPYALESKHGTLGECQTAKANSFSYADDGTVTKNGSTGVCVGTDLYLKTDRVTMGGTQKHEYTECDYWAGCFFDIGNNFFGDFRG